MMPARLLRDVRSWWPIPAFWLLMLLMSGFDWTWAVLRASILVGIAVLVLVCLRMGRVQGEAAGQRGLAYAVAALGVIHVIYLLVNYRANHLSDVAQSTLLAVTTQIQGSSLYTTSLDPGGVVIAGPAFSGYKYLPVMPAAYAPLVLAFGRSGILLTNVLLDLSMAGLVFVAAARERGRASGMLAAALYLSLPFAMLQILKQGATDPVPMIFLMGALLVTDRWPALAGLLLGLSISSKLMPGLAAAPACLPARGRVAFVLGLGAGILPALLAFLGAPGPFVDNIVRFNLVRPMDGTNWMVRLSPPMADVAKALLGLLWAALALVSIRWSRDIVNRCGMAALLILAVILGGSILHHNYVLWPVPFMCVIMAMRVPGMHRDVHALAHVSSEGVATPPDQALRVPLGG